MRINLTSKYFFVFLLSAMLAGPVAAQNIRRDKKKAKTELPTNDSIPKQTLTHSTPIPGIQPPPRPKRPKFLVGHVDDSYQLNVGSFVNMTTDDLRSVFAPNVTIKPFVRFFDKYTIGAYANVIVQNYATKEFSAITNYAYLDMAAQTKIGKINIKIGKVPVINYPNYFAESVPLGNFLLHRIHLDSRRFVPRAIIASYTGQEMSFGIGYGENTDGFGFMGDGYLIMFFEQKILDNFQMGGFVLDERRQSFGDVYIAYQPTQRDAILLQLLDFGAQPTFYGLYRHTLKNEDAAFSINGFTQSKDGVRGADIAFQHIKSGTYVSAGAHYRDPLMNPQESAQWTPFIQVGINKTLFPKKVR
ncbi:MAG: hypothetical protein IJQ90_01735 [Alphaproteobacteria bacterium]|nr:hypothetical protein [Alphaproteobacteria bacterium]